MEELKRQWLTKNGIVDRNGGGNAEDYIIPIVFAEMDYVSVRALVGWQLL